MSGKPYKSYLGQLQLLKDRGLVVQDDAQALHVLEHHNYYRLSAYRFPFQDSTDQFRPGTTFEQLWELYRFDRILRQLVSEACEVIEVSVRARWAHVLGEKHGAQAYEKLSVFCDLSAPEKKKQMTAKNLLDNLAALDRELTRSKEVFVTHFRFEKQVLRPPIWVISEAISFGLLSRFYDGISRESDKKKISRTYDLSVDGLRSVLQQAVYLRNLCAHHSRLWNRKLTVKVSLPTSQPPGIISSLNPSEKKRIYNSLILLGHMVDVIVPASDWKVRLRAHLETLNGPSHAEMGFPVDWRDRNFWKVSI